LTRKWLFLLLIIALVLAADQFTKRIVVERLAVGESRQPIPALVPLFQITRSQNTGAAFGFLQGAGDSFFVIAIIVVIAMLIFYPRIPDKAWMIRLASGLIIGGASGNALDRLQYGSVVDFIHYQIPGLISNVSNIADHAIVFGVLCIFVVSWRTERSQSKTEPAAQPETDNLT
jgi:signal peptidase II